MRDTGNEVLFSAHDKAAGEAARQYAVKKWGKALRKDGNMLCREKTPEPTREHGREPKKRRGMER